MDISTSNLSKGGFLLLAFSVFGIQVQQKVVEKDIKRIGLDCGITEMEIEEKISESQAENYLIVVIGDHLPDSSHPSTHKYPVANAQGVDIFEGIKLAMDTSRFWKEVQDDLTVISIDDAGDMDCALQIAEIVSRDSRVLAVIGHSNSGSTKATLPLYRKANIPVLVPNSTNPNLLYHEGKLLTNAFRLPANDDIQVRAMLQLIQDSLQSKSIYLVLDHSPAAKLYSEYIGEALRRQLRGKISGSHHVLYEPLSPSALPGSIYSHDPDLVIFVGFGSMARELLDQLDRRYAKHARSDRPKVLLSDGCKVAELKDCGFATYITFPNGSAKAGIRAQAPNYPSDPYKSLREQSFEIPGHDALVILAQTYQQLKKTGRISRRDMIKTLEAEVFNEGCYHRYNFEKGENTYKQYYGYHVSAKTYFPITIN